ncbi:MAG: hypothetical protein RLZZ262_201 [Bacteroidota bacterium]|jgi:hypothetical protein
MHTKEIDGKKQDMGLELSNHDAKLLRLTERS